MNYLVAKTEYSILFRKKQTRYFTGKPLGILSMTWTTDKNFAMTFSKKDNATKVANRLGGRVVRR